MKKKIDYSKPIQNQGIYSVTDNATLFFGWWLEMEKDMLHLDKYKTTFTWASYQEVLDFCNKVRQAGGGLVLNSLLPSIPNHASECLIAKNLNFGCKVFPHVDINRQSVNEKYNPIGGSLHELSYSKDWVMVLDDNSLTLQIADSLNLDIVVHYDSASLTSPLQFGIRLPRKIGNAAHAFDLEIDFRQHTGRL